MKFPDYKNLTHEQYLELVLSELENKYGKEIDLIFIGFEYKEIALMINDACLRFRVLNCSPQFTVEQIDGVLSAKHSEIVQ